MNNATELSAKVEEIVRRSEVEAVARALRTGQTPRVGEMIDYEIEGVRQKTRRSQPYRVAIEQWHLDAARGMVGI